MSQREVLIVGSSGQVGRSVMRTLQAAGQAVRGTTRSRHNGTDLRLDLAEISDPRQVALAIKAADLSAPSAMFCLGGMTWVDGCEHNPELAFRTNATGPTALATYAANFGIPFAFVSTDYVFAGRASTAGPYDEGAIPEPLNDYGASKLAGERGILAAHPGALVVRTTWVYGPDEQGKNNAYSVVRALAAGQRMSVAADQISTPTYNGDLAEALVELVRSGATGLFHVAGRDVMDRLEWARRIGASCGLNTSLLEGVTTAAMNLPAERPLHGGLISRRLGQQLPALRMRSLDEGLAASHGALLTVAAESAAGKQSPVARTEQKKAMYPDGVHGRKS